MAWHTRERERRNEKGKRSTLLEQPLIDIHAGWLLYGTHERTDGRTDRQTDGQTDGLVRNGMVWYKGVLHAYIPINLAFLGLLLGYLYC